MNVLYLSAWYPTPHDEMSGLFVRKHLDSVRGQGVDARVIYSEQTGCRYWSDLYGQYRRLQKDGWRPDLVQVNVLNKNGLLAYWWWRTRHIPYIIVEHWSGYLPANFSFRGGWHGWLMRKIARHARAILPVSNRLMQAMKECGIANANWQIVHNVVDDFFFQLASQPHDNHGVIQFVHVSCFDEKAKNTLGLLRAYKAARAKCPAMHLTMVGTGVDWQASVDYAQELGLDDAAITWTGELTPMQVSHQLAQSDCFLLFSRYENAPVVLSECMAAGLPIISSRAGGIPEMVYPECGELVDVGDEAQFTRAILNFASHPNTYLPNALRTHADIYREQVIGAALVQVYERCISR